MNTTETAPPTLLRAVVDAHGRVLGTALVHPCNDHASAWTADAVTVGATVNRRRARLSRAKRLIARGERSCRDWEVAGLIADEPVLVELTD